MVILNIANFYRDRLNSSRAYSATSHRVSFGLRQNGHYVVEISDRDWVRSLGLCGLSKKYGIWKMGRRLLEVIDTLTPDQVWLGGGGLVDSAILEQAKQRYPKLTTILYDVDQLGKPVQHILDKIPHLDWLFFTSGGEGLRWYRNAGCPNTAFFPNITDPALDTPTPFDSKWQSKVLFTGGLHDVPERRELIEYLAKNAPITLYGCLGNRKIAGFDYYKAVSNTKIGIDFNGLPYIDKCLSNRTVNYMGCGTMLLSKTVPFIETIFTPGKEIVTFDTKEECLEKINYYLKHDNERIAIAKAGQKAVWERFSPEIVVKDMLDSISGNIPKRPWTEVLHA